MTKGEKTSKKFKKEGMGTIALLIIFLLTLMPLILAPFSFIGATDSNEYSIFNQSSTGLSKFRNSISSNHQIFTIMSSYNELTPNKTDFNTSNMVLISVGPKKLYNPMEIIPLVEFLSKGGKMLLCMDFGTANELLLVHDLMYLLYSGAQNLGVEFKNGIVMETDSNFYENSSDILRLWGPCLTSHSLMNGITMIKMSRATYLDEGFFFGGVSTSNYVIKTTSTAFFDVNGNGIHDDEEDEAPANGFPLIISIYNDQVVIITDADIFSNTLYDEYDNSKLADNIITALTAGENCAILFDEVHQVKLFPNIFGFILSFVNANNTFLFSLPLTPLLTYYSFKRFIPQPKKPKITKESKILRRKGKTLYGERMKWFKERREYNKAISLLARRLKRTLIQALELKNYDIDNIINQVKMIKPNENISRIKYGLKKIEDIEKNRKKIKEDYEFLNLYYEMRWISDAVTK
ncbi:MAG: hypothetical protein EAX96_12115 [Candidatus Lokiarchaeota archaeon]|nr:hypothetical protein [Candidatus Lokiarchaeota archaeon]